MSDKCSLGSMNNNLKIIGLIFLACILFIVILYYFKNTIDKHNNLMEKFSSNVATIDYSNSYTNTSSVDNADQDNDTYNGEITLRNCQVYFVGEDEKNACDASYIADPLNTTCKYEFKDGWKEIESIQGSENQRNDIQKKIYNKDYGNINNIDNQYYMSSCFKEMQGGDNNFRYMGNEHVMHDNIGTVNDQTNKNNTLRLNTQGTGTMSNYISKKFFNKENNTNLSNNNNMLDSICSIKYNNIPNLKTKFYKFKLIQIDNEWVMEDLKDVVLNDTQTSFGGDEDSTFVGNEAYGVFFKSFSNSIVKLSIFKKSSVENIPNLKVYRFKYNYLCDGKVLEYSDNITTTIKMDKLVNNSGGNEISIKTLDIKFNHGEINDNFWSNDLFKSNNFENKIVEIRNGLTGLGELYAKMMTDEYSELTAPHLQIKIDNNALLLTSGADKKLFHTQVNISGVEEGNFEKESIVGLTKNGNINFNYNSGYNIIVRDKNVSKTIGKYTGAEPITNPIIKPINIGEDYKYIYFDYNPSIMNPVLPIDTTNLLVHYKFAGNLLDSSGNNKTLRKFGNPIINNPTDNKFPYSRYINGTEQTSRDFAISPDINKNVPLSFAFWFYVQSTKYATMVSYGDYDRNVPSIQFDIYNGGTQINVYTALSNHWTITPYVGGLAMNTWHHCVYTLDNSNRVMASLYINGVLGSTGLGNTGRTLPTTRHLVLCESGDKGRGFHGKLTDVRVYDKVLTQTEVTQLYNILPENIEYSVNFPEDTECDILVLGGGGAGGKNTGGGGGSGAFIINQGLILNGNHTVYVGKGGIPSNKNGNPSYISNTSGIIVRADGGGGGGDLGNSSVTTSGCTGGGGGGSTSGSTSQSPNPNTNKNIVDTTKPNLILASKGGNGFTMRNSVYNEVNAGGGGGLGGFTSSSTATASSPGIGNDGIYQATVGSITYNFGDYGIGVLSGGNYYIGGGGGGGGYQGTNIDISGGKGGGGTGKDQPNPTPLGGDAINGTGSGGGGGGANAFSDNGGAGGSGIVIIRYRTEITNDELRNRSSEPDNINIDYMSKYLNFKYFGDDENIKKNAIWDNTGITIINAYKLKTITIMSFMFLQKGEYVFDISLGIKSTSVIYMNPTFLMNNIDIIAVGFNKFKTVLPILQGGFYMFVYKCEVLLNTQENIKFYINDTLTNTDLYNYLYGGSNLHSAYSGISSGNVENNFQEVLFINNTAESLYLISKYLTDTNDHWSMKKYKDAIEKADDAITKYKNILDARLLSLNGQLNHIIGIINSIDYQDPTLFKSIPPTLNKHVKLDDIFSNYQESDFVTHEKINNINDRTPTINTEITYSDNIGSNPTANFATNFATPNYSKRSIYVLRE